MKCFLSPRVFSPSKSAGFSLIESLVAITVLLTAVVAPLVIVSGSIATANIAKDQITAFYLANEAIEYIHNTRDTNFLKNQDWLAGLDACVGGKCFLNGHDAALGIGTPLQVCTGGDCPNFILNSYSSPQQTFYNYDVVQGGRQTTFNRSIVITRNLPPPSDNEAKVEITITWKTGSLLGTGSVPKQFKATTIMQRWL